MFYLRSALRQLTPPFFAYFVGFGMDIQSEKKLLRQVAEGNEQAFRELVFLYADLLGNYVYRLTRSRETAEEIVQDVFVKIWMSREVLAEIELFRNYIFVLSRNHTLNALRKLSREKVRRKGYENFEITQHDETDKGSDLPGLIDEAIAQLPPQQRRAWQLSRKQGLSHQQIAREMNLSKETVKKYIMYANHSLSTYIKEKLK